MTFASSTLAIAAVGSAQMATSPDPGSSSMQPVVETIASRVPLRVQVTRRTALKRGARVEGVLLEPVFVGAQKVLPAQAIVTGHVLETPSVDRSTRVWALLDGDFTPLRTSVVAFDTVRLPGGAAVSMNTVAHVRQAELIRFKPKQKESLLHRLTGLVHERVDSIRQQGTAPHKSDRALRMLFSQLPYHPQRIWANTDFDAELQAPLTLGVPSPEAIVPAPADALFREQPVVKGRLTAEVSSDGARTGDAVHAVLTEPAYDAEHRMIFPEGAALNGVVLQAKASRSFGRNGALRFAFRGVQPVEGETRALQGQVTGAEGQQSANVTVDEEGGVHANPDKNRFIAPLLLAALASHGEDEDGSAAQLGVASNGMGIVVRGIGFAAGSRNFATGVGAYGLCKSIYRHFLAHGKPVLFPRDTAIEVQLSTRR